MFNEYLKRMGITGVNLKTVILSGIITLFALFAILSSFHLKNVGLSSILGMKIMLNKTFISTFTYFLTQVFFVALWEEILFRGYAQNILEACFADKMKRYSWIFAIGISSLLFTIFHLFNTNELTFSLRFFNVFFGSLVIGYAYYKTRNIWVSVFVHGGYNTLDKIVTDFIMDRAAFISTILNGELTHSGAPQDVSNYIANKVSELIRG